MGRTNYTPYTPAGYFAITATSAAAAGLPATAAASAASATLSAPDYAIFVAESTSCRWRDDGTAPTTTVGTQLPAATYFRYDGKLSAIQFISAVGQTIVHANLYRTS